MKKGDSVKILKGLAKDEIGIVIVVNDDWITVKHSDGTGKVYQKKDLKRVKE